MPQDAPGPQADDAHHAALNEIITMGTDFARRLHAQGMAQPQPAPPNPPAPLPATLAPEAPALAPPAPEVLAREALIRLAAAFDRVARTVRRSIFLARSLDRLRPPARDPAQARAAARKRIIREVEDRIGYAAARGDAANAPSLHAGLDAELRDRLDAPDLDDDLATRPVAEVITEICRDLGLASPPGDTPWKRRTPADLAGLNARAASRGGPRPRSPTPDAPPARLASALHARPTPVHPGDAGPNGPADLLATVLRHATRTAARWHPPPGG